MNKALFLTFILVLFLFTACSPASSPAADSGSAAPSAEVPFSVTIGGVVLVPGMEGNTEELLGTPMSRIQAASCVHEGTDILYTYADAEISAEKRSESSAERITSVALLTPKLSTAEGVRIGDPETAVTAAYGDCEPKSGRYTYSKGGVTLAFRTVNGVVTAILYSCE